MRTPTPPQTVARTATLAWIAPLLLAACQKQDVSLPEREPDVRGTVTRIEADARGEGVRRVLIEEEPHEESGSTKIWFTVVPATRVLVETGTGRIPASAGDVRVGRRAAAWAAGPIRESYPAQAEGGTILLLR